MIARTFRRTGPYLPCLAAMLLATGGCATPDGSQYVRQTLPVEQTWHDRKGQDQEGQDQAGGAPRLRNGPWWDAFGDPELSALIERTLAQNAGLAAAGIRRREARMAAAQAAIGLLPSLGAGVSGGATQGLEKGASGAENSSGSIDAAWEVDLFGRLNAEVRAARWEAQAREHDLAATRLSLAGTVASSWWQLAYANERIALATQSLAYLRKTRELITRQYDAGAVSLLALREVQQSVAAQEATLTQLEQARIETKNALAALLGQQVYDGSEPAALLRAPLPAIEPGLPAELLARRPDLAASEARLRKTLATSDATAASYYPRLSLTGALGTASDRLLSLISNPVAGIGAALSLPTLNPEEIRFGTAVARADYTMAAEQFRQDFYDALRDAASALSARQRYVQQARALDRTLAAAAEAEGLYGRQYAAGSIALRSWLDAVERRRSAQASVIENLLNQHAAQIAVYQAFGGDISTGSSTAK